MLVHAIIEDSPRHGEARSLLEGLDEWVLPSIVLYELVWILRKLGADSAKVREVVEVLLDNPKTAVVAGSGAYARRAARVLEEEVLGPARFNNKIVLAAAIDLGLPLATYDGELRREARELGVVLLSADVEPRARR